MQQLAFSQTLTAADFLLIALVKLAALVSCLSQRLSRRANFPGGVRRG
ncbi:chloride channel protein [Klebsiella pneumoniae]|uniref:Chloride channel protein n=1 Tax=Klebsiella pneumoniae TaxID=573 RepID=A0A2X1QPV4_KLEPN|nr:chloride channel protein [Klebsiella pneumoniae]